MPFWANSGQYAATGASKSNWPRECSIRAHSVVWVLVLDQTLVMVSRSHGAVWASSTQPPQMSTTSSPCSTTAAQQPTSAPLSMFADMISAIAAKRGSKVPWISAITTPSEFVARGQRSRFS